MNTFSAFAMGQAFRDAPVKVFDWKRAEKILAENPNATIRAGLQNDWEWTGGTIAKNGRRLTKDETYTYLASTWANPQIEVDGKTFECWVWASNTPGWNAETFWPDLTTQLLIGEDK